MRVVGRMVLDRNPDNFFAETEQVAYCTSPCRARYRFHQRSAVAGPAVLLSGYSVEAARRAELPPDPDQPAEMPVPQSAARWPYADERVPKGQVNYEPSSLGAGHRPRIGRSAVTGPSRLSRAGETVAHPSRNLRRSLHPGADVLRQPDGAGTEPYRLRRWCSNSANACCQGSARRFSRGLVNVDQTLAFRVAKGLGLKSEIVPAPMHRFRQKTWTCRRRSASLAKAYADAGRPQDRLSWYRKGATAILSLSLKAAALDAGAKFEDRSHRRSMA